MSVLKVILEYITCFWEVFLAVYFFSAFGDKKFKTKFMLPIICTFAFIYGTAVITITNPNVLFVFSILIILALAFTYKLKWYNSIFLSVIFSVISGLFELFVIHILSFGGQYANTQNQSLYLYICGLIASKTFTFLTVLVIRKSGHKPFNYIKTSHFLGLLMLPCSTIIISMLLSKVMFWQELNIAWRVGTVVALILLIASNAMIFYIVDTQYKIIHIEEELKTSRALLESEKQYYESIFESQKEIRKMRHDLKNIFIAVLGELDLGDTQSAKKILNSKLDEADKYIPINEDSGIIDAVIYSKYQFAENKNVKLEVTERIDQKITIDNLDLCVLIGNILDNAIEAASECGSDSTVTFNLVTDNQNLIILCKNPTHNNINKGELLRTTKKDKENHGFGILSIKSIAEKYSGSYVYDCKNGIFTSTIILVNRS